MKVTAIWLLVCPMDKGTLELNAEQSVGDDVLAGILRCMVCNVEYPIYNGVPVLMPKEILDIVDPVSGP